LLPLAHQWHPHACACLGHPAVACHDYQLLWFARPLVLPPGRAFGFELEEDML
jgi:hypothetical protein